MTNQICRAVVIGLAAASLLLAPRAEGAEPQQQDAGTARLDKVFGELEQELQESARKMYDLEIRIPSEFDPAEEERRTRALAERAGLGPIGVERVAETERVPLADGRPSHVELYRMKVSGRAPFDKVHQFLIYRGSLNRLVELETLHLKAEDGGAVSFEARFAFPRALLDEAAPGGQTPEEMLRQEVVRRQLTYQMLSELTARSNPTRLVAALALFGRAMEAKAGLNEIAFDGPNGGNAVLMGKVSNGSQDRLEPALGKAGFQVGDVKMSPAGSCQTFTVTARLAAGEQKEEATRHDDPFENGPACGTAP